MKQILNILQMLIFFIVYKYCNIFIASGSLVLTSGCICLFYWIFYNQIDKINIFSFLMISLFSFLTILFHNAQFIKWKITIIYIIFATVLFISQFFTNKPIMQTFLEKDIKIPHQHWRKINFFWLIFFLCCAVLNIYISLYCSEANWVIFKVFGLTILTLILILVTGIYINYIKFKKK
ncbi:septation protein A [Buchnera aphidicola]|uniref:Inner membrane-spanning protein YciB n=1 Tax=Buchnera aphidicola subsp. Uroleucon sonchi TaxID=118118 RepID=A0A6C1FG19_BUCUN|nr:septation protein A [Buchnera aphidicola]QIE01992.1 septation protein A [Buchnera aphidicola (Uroleucon sonchi)]